MRTLTSLLVFIGFLGMAVPASAQYRITNPTGNEESVCTNDSNVFLCDNFEDMTAGNIPFMVGGYKRVGWFNSPTNSQQIVSGAQCFGGSGNCLRIRTPAGVASGGTVEQGWGGNKTVPPTSYREIYWRMYQRFDSNYVFSQIGTKGWEWFSNAGGGETGVWNTTANAGITVPLFTLITNAGLVPPFDGIWHLLQNINGTQSFVLNQWYCLEMHLKYNTGASTSDGTLEMWTQRIGIDANPVQHWTYQNVLLDSRANNQTNGLFLVSYINCDSSNDPNGQICVEQHGIRDKYIDNLIVSTARIGCGAPIIPPALTPNPPTNPRLISWLLAGLPIAGLIALGWRNR